MGHHLLNIPFPAQGGLPPLLRAEASQIFGQRRALGVRQRPQLAVFRSRHIARSVAG
jgi:hypothetical protein